MMEDCARKLQHFRIMMIYNFYAMLVEMYEIIQSVIQCSLSKQHIQRRLGGTKMIVQLFKQKDFVENMLQLPKGDPEEQSKALDEILDVFSMIIRALISSCSRSNLGNHQYLLNSLVLLKDSKMA